MYNFNKLIYIVNKIIILHVDSDPGGTLLIMWHDHTNIKLDIYIVPTYDMTHSEVRVTIQSLELFEQKN